MYNIPIIGAVVVNTNGNSVGIIQSIEDGIDGVQIVIEELDVTEDGTEDEVVPPKRLRTVGKDE